jgi:long-chain acyl-CoA synthetase
MNLNSNTNFIEIGNVGFPSPCLEIKLKSHPSLGYTINDKPNPRGELLYRGPVCSLGILL